jgi:hypothetical protein
MDIGHGEYSQVVLCKVGGGEFEWGAAVRAAALTLAFGHFWSRILSVSLAGWIGPKHLLPT